MMKWNAMILAAVLVFIISTSHPGTEALPAAVDRVTSALTGSFDALNTKRDDWLNVYTDLRNSSKLTGTQLDTLTFTGNAAYYLLWILYATNLGTQRQYYQTIANEGPQDLPVGFRVSKLPNGPNLHLEAKLTMSQYQDFQIKILKDSKEIYFMNVNFNERRAVLGYKEDQEVHEEVVLTGSGFPNITLNQEFRINVQIMDDCLITTIWPREVHLFTPSRPSDKYIWCSRDYSLPYYYAFHIDATDGSEGSHEAYQQQQQQHFSWQQEQQSEEESDEEEGRHQEGLKDGPLKLVSAVVYGGVILM